QPYNPHKNLSLRDALPICAVDSSTAKASAATGLEKYCAMNCMGEIPSPSTLSVAAKPRSMKERQIWLPRSGKKPIRLLTSCTPRSEEHTSELQSRENLVCR